MTRRVAARLARALREPAVLLAAVGAGLFLLHGAVAPEPGGREVEIDEPVVEGVRLEFRRRMGREPTAAEVRSEVEALVDEEILYREAVALGLDRGDRVVRRRMVQKMELLFEDTTVPAEPADGELEAYLAEQRARYLRPATASFDHVFLRGGEGSAERARALLAELRSGRPALGAGDPFPLGAAVAARTGRQVEEGFGPEVAEGVEAAPAGEWAGPFASRFGQHLVRVTDRAGERAPRLAEVRDRVRTDLLRERAERANRASLESLRADYEITVRYPSWMAAGEGGRDRALALADRGRP